MKKHPTVAIYSGVSVSTTFIERLIKGLAKSNTFVYIFGAYTGRSIHLKNVKYIAYRSKWHKLFVLLKYTLLLILFKPKDKKKLDAIISKNRKDRHLLQLKYYPVLYYKPCIFHIQWAKSLEDWVWVQNFGMKLVLSLRGAHINYSPIVDEQLAHTYKKWFPKILGFHAVSNAIAQEATKYNVDFNSIKVVKSGLNLSEFPFKIKDFESKKTLSIISVGRNHWKKNYKLALDVIYQLKLTGKRCHYTIIGVAENEALLFQRAQLELENEVSLLDNMPFKEVKDAIQKADVMLLSSVEEGIANVVLEAMALGTLVISTDCGGMAEVVIPNQTGYLVPIRDPEIMTQALKTVSELPLETYQQITKQARDFIEMYHNETDMVLEMQSLYDNLIQSDL